MLDLGCGPGWSLPELPTPQIALDVTGAFIDRVAGYAPDALRVQADLEHLPFRRGAIGAAWASRSLIHVPRSSLPLALWDLHRSLRVGGPIHLTLLTGDTDFSELADDEFGGRRFARWPAALLGVVLEGAGFGDVVISEPDQLLIATARRRRTLADTVGGDMSLLCVGLNPSPYAADVGVGFGRPGNRFWPAALEAGIVTADRDPIDALRRHGVGMTDVVKRATPRADEITKIEFEHGIERLDALCGWLQPRAVCIVGLSGWRAAVDRKAVVGPQERRLGGCPTFVMHNPSGLNAHVTVADLAEQLRSAAAP